MLVQLELFVIDLEMSTLSGSNESATIVDYSHPFDPLTNGFDATINSIGDDVYESFGAPISFTAYDNAPLLWYTIEYKYTMVFLNVMVNTETGIFPSFFLAYRFHSNRELSLYTQNDTTKVMFIVIQ